MKGAAVSLIALNLAAVSALLVASAVCARRSGSDRVRQLWLAIAAFAAVLMSGWVVRLFSHVPASGSPAARMWQRVEPIFSVVPPVAGLAVGVVALVLVPRAVRALQQSERMYTAMLRRVSSLPSLEDIALTRREREVVDVLRAGSLDNASIAERLGIAPNTAGTHVRNIMRKAGAADRRDLMLLGERNG